MMQGKVPLYILAVLTLISCTENPVENNPIDPIGDPPVYPSIDGFPAWSPDGKRIIYTHHGITRIDIGGSYLVNRDSAGLWIVNVDGTNPHLILKGVDINANWSPDGKWIVFEKNTQIYKAPFKNDSIDITRIQQLTFEGRNFFPAWSPDGEWIVYDSNADSPNGMKFVWKMKVDGSEKRRIAYEPAMGEIRMPHWSLDGKKIVHIRYLVGTFSSEIFLMDSSGTNPLRLTFNNATDYYPKYTPDGTKIMFQSVGESKSGVWIMNADGSNLHWLINGYQPYWSPDGKKIAFISSRTETINDNGTIWVVDIDGTNLRQLTHGP